ncbi:FecR protein [Bacteroides salyersiae]|uniref:FecR family protein n=1 Tax=Bacteroides salyersiae TaxID=291644 RepID=UPI001B8CED56|nr:FecR domain-containing protein [Bacteroides salyersiae]QUT74739.1 FecR protein [Bacteroides salyersiae]
MKKESIKTFFKSQCPPDSGKIEQWYIDNIDSAELDTILLELLKECTRQDEPKTRDAFNRTCHRMGIETPKVTRKRKIYRWASGMAASILICGFLLGIHTWKSQSGGIDLEKVYASAGNSKVVTLPDSTKIYLKPTSALFYEANGFARNRKVHLFGEAYVEVTKDVKHPFSVVCNNATIKVLGTKFNVQSHESDSEFEVMLYEGCVDVESEFNNKQVEVLMAPGDIVKIDKNTGEMSQMNISTIANQGQSRKFYFIDKKLEDITNQLERHFQKKIVITNPQLKPIRYDAIFANDETIEQILNYLNASQQMNIIYHDNTIIEIR